MAHLAFFRIITLIACQHTPPVISLMLQQEDGGYLSTVLRTADVKIAFSSQLVNIFERHLS